VCPDQCKINNVATLLPTPILKFYEEVKESVADFLLKFNDFEKKNPLF